MVHVHVFAPALQAYYDSNNAGEQLIECIMTRRYSHSENFIGITTSTESPMVNEYMIFTVRVNEIVERVYYMVSQRDRRARLLHG